MGLEPMTSPLPRECSTTELHQPSKTSKFILPRTVALQYDAEGKVAQNNPRQRAVLAWLHRAPDQYSQNPKNGNRNPHSSAAGRA